MTYYFTKTISEPFGQAIDTVTQALKDKGFGVLSTIDVQKAMKEKIDKQINPYTILGACNPGFAYEALSLENKIGVMLPCNVVVQELDSGEVEVTAVDPVSSMSAIENENLAGIAMRVQDLLKEVIDGL